jgi:hypothetical protein
VRADRKKAAFRECPDGPKKRGVGKFAAGHPEGATETILPDASWNRQGSGYVKAVPCDTSPAARVPWAEETRPPGRSRTLAKRLGTKLAALRSSEVKRGHSDCGCRGGGLRGTDRNPSRAMPDPDLWPSSGRPVNSGADPPHCKASLLPCLRNAHPGAESTMPDPSFPSLRLRQTPPTPGKNYRRKPPDRQILKTPKWAYAISAPPHTVLMMNKKRGELQY